MYKYVSFIPIISALFRLPVKKFVEHWKKCEIGFVLYINTRDDGYFYPLVDKLIMFHLYFI